MKIADWLSQSTQDLSNSGIESARLDCLILLEHILQKDRVYILSHSDDLLLAEESKFLTQLLHKRKNNEPIAYLIGTKEFYGRSFIVTPKVLIPRPESEDIIEIINTLSLPKSSKLIDVGTGSGVLAITAALEFPDLHVLGFDIDSDALLVAEKNKRLHDAEVTFGENNLLLNVQTTAECIIANLPYVAPDQSISPSAAFEPPLALFAENDGLNLIFKLIEQVSKATLSSDGFLILESEPRQHKRIQSFAEDRGLKFIRTINFIQLFQKN